MHLHYYWGLCIAISKSQWLKSEEETKNTRLELQCLASNPSGRNPFWKQFPNEQRQKCWKPGKDRRNISAARKGRKEKKQRGRGPGPHRRDDPKEAGDQPRVEPPHPYGWGGAGDWGKRVHKITTSPHPWEAWLRLTRREQGGKLV